MFRNEDIIILLGAGASADAGIPTSRSMVNTLENLINTDEKWREFKQLFFYMKSSILYVDGISGKFSEYADIERLVNTLSELEKKDNCIIYPFIGSWNPKLLEIASYNFDIIKIFKNKIVDQLKNWVTLRDYKKAKYYSKIFDFQEQYNYPLRVFSLNYDLCLEKNNQKEKSLERGFHPETKTWDATRFYPTTEEANIYLYKLHGSLDWERDEEKGGIVREVDNIPDKPSLIFGTDYKLQYTDPYLYHAYEFRTHSLEAKIILIIGYGFNDEHINGILKQALNYDHQKRLFVVDEKGPDSYMKLDINKEQILVSKSKAADFLNQLSIESLETALH
jgi:hypothetical protein